MVRPTYPAECRSGKSGGALGTQPQTGLLRILKGTPARIVVALLLTLLALPVIYLGIFGIFAIYLLFREDDAFLPHAVLLILVPVLVVLSAFGTLLSFRSALITAAALAIFYLGWAFTIYPFPDLLPSSASFWTNVTMFALLSLNLVWMAWTLRRRAVAHR